MICEIVPIKSNYRGMERVLLATDLLLRSTKKSNFLIEKYYDYIDNTLKKMNAEIVFKFFEFSAILESFKIPNEIIVYDNVPLHSFYEFDLEFLGIDIVYEMEDSLIANTDNFKIQKFLNNNGLCQNLEDMQNLLIATSHIGQEWKPCYVYRVKQVDN